MPQENNFPRMYLSGFPPSAFYGRKGMTQMQIEKEFIKRTGNKYRCWNYAYCAENGFLYSKKIGATYKLTLKLGLGIMMDSSAFTFHRFIQKQAGGKIAKNKKQLSAEDFERLKNDVIKGYVDFVKADGKKWDFYVTFDYIKNCDVIWQMQKYLEKKGIKPAPVYHGDMGLEYFKRYCDRGHKLICVGLMRETRNQHLARRDYYERLFRIAEPYKVRLHALGVTNLYNMLEFPFWSVDSSTWCVNARVGAIAYPDVERNTLRKFHVSDRGSDVGESYNRMPKSIRREVEDYVTSHGFDFDKVRTEIGERCAFNAYVFCNLPKLIDTTSRKAEWENLLEGDIVKLRR